MDLYEESSTAVSRVSGVGCKLWVKLPIVSLKKRYTATVATTGTDLQSNCEHQKDRLGACVQTRGPEAGRGLRADPGKGGGSCTAAGILDWCPLSEAGGLHLCRSRLSGRAHY
eukprot:364848-Chlamydomonas_euryale.AAC.6